MLYREPGGESAMHTFGKHHCGSGGDKRRHSATSRIAFPSLVPSCLGPLLRPPTLLHSHTRPPSLSTPLIMSSTENVVAVYPTSSVLDLQGNWTDLTVAGNSGSSATVAVGAAGASGSLKFTGEQGVAPRASPLTSCPGQVPRSASTACSKRENPSSRRTPSTARQRTRTSGRQT